MCPVRQDLQLIFWIRLCCSRPRGNQDIVLKIPVNTLVIFLKELTKTYNQRNYREWWKHLTTPMVSQGIENMIITCDFKNDSSVSPSMLPKVPNKMFIPRLAPVGTIKRNTDVRIKTTIILFWFIEIQYNPLARLLYIQFCDHIIRISDLGCGSWNQNRDDFSFKPNWFTINQCSVDLVKVKNKVTD